MTEQIPKVLKYKNWPLADQSAWDGLFVKAELFGDDGPCAGWSKGTRTKRCQGYGQWLSFLKRTAPEVMERKPTNRIKKSLVRHYIAECQERLKPHSVAGLVTDLYVIAKGLQPNRDWDWLANVTKRLQADARSHSLPPPLPITATEIFQWSLKRMDELESLDGLSDKKRAIWFREALMIGFLISRPVRRRAVLAMTSNSHLGWQSNGFDIQFSAADMKDKKDRSFPLPKALVSPLKCYLQIHRPELLAGKQSDGLWINQYGDPITPDGFSRQLPKVTLLHLGLEMRPHAFRNVAATSVAEFDPVHVNIIRDLLGHATLDMAEKHYNRATGISACNELQAIVDEVRRSRR